MENKSFWTCQTFDTLFYFLFFFWNWNPYTKKKVSKWREIFYFSITVFPTHVCINEKFVECNSFRPDYIYICIGIQVAVWLCWCTCVTVRCTLGIFMPHHPFLIHFVWKCFPSFSSLTVFTLSPLYFIFRSLFLFFFCFCGSKLQLFRGWELAGWEGGSFRYLYVV